MGAAMPPLGAHAQPAPVASGDSSPAQEFFSLNVPTPSDSPNAASSPAKPSAWRRLLLPAKLALGGAVLLALRHWGYLDFAFLHNVLRHPSILALAVLSVLVTVPICAGRWFLLMRALNLDVSYRKVLPATFSGLFANIFMPGSAGGDVVRALLLFPGMAGQRSAVLLSLLADRVVGLMALVAFTSAALGLRLEVVRAHAALSALGVTLACLLVAILVGLVVFSLVIKRVERWCLARNWPEGGAVRRLAYQGVMTLAAYRDRPLVVLACLGLSILIQFFSILGIYLTARCLDLTSLSLADLCIAGPVAWVTASLPVTPGGLGLGEGVFAKICQMLDPATGAVYGTAYLAFRGVTMLSTLPGGLAYLLDRPRNKLAAR